MSMRYLGFLLLVWFPGVLHAQSPAQACPAPSLNGGYLVPEQEAYSDGTEIFYACDNGLKPAVEGWWGTVTCQNGMWSNEPQCIDEKACLPPDIPNAKYRESSSGWYEEERKIMITCNQAYEPKDGDVTARCINGTWSSLPVCERSIHACSEPPQTPHAVIVHQRYQEVFPQDSQVNYECEDGFTVKGEDSSKVIFCMAGNWTDVPTCIRETTPGSGPGSTDAAADRAQPGGGDSSTGGGSTGRGTGRGDTTSTGSGTAAGRDSSTGQGGSTGGGTGRGHTTSTSSGTAAGRDSSTGRDVSTGRGTGSGHTTSTGSGTAAGRGSPSTSGLEDRDSRPAVIAVEHCGRSPLVPNGDVVQKEQMFLKYQCNAFYTLVGPEAVVCYSDGSWSTLPTCKATFCSLNRAQHPDLNLPGDEFLKHGEEKAVWCTSYGYFSNIQCSNGRLTRTRCCSSYDHYWKYC